MHRDTDACRWCGTSSRPVCGCDADGRALVVVPRLFTGPIYPSGTGEQTAHQCCRAGVAWRCRDGQYVCRALCLTMKEKPKTGFGCRPPKEGARCSTVPTTLPGTDTNLRYKRHRHKSWCRKRTMHGDYCTQTTYPTCLPCRPVRGVISRAS